MGTSSVRDTCAHMHYGLALHTCSPAKNSSHFGFSLLVLRGTEKRRLWCGSDCTTATCPTRGCKQSSRTMQRMHHQRQRNIRCIRSHTLARLERHPWRLPAPATCMASIPRRYHECCSRTKLGSASLVNSFRLRTHSGSRLIRGPPFISAHSLVGTPRCAAT